MEKWNPYNTDKLISYLNSNPTTFRYHLHGQLLIDKNIRNGSLGYQILDYLYTCDLFRDDLHMIIDPQKEYLINRELFRLLQKHYVVLPSGLAVPKFKITQEGKLRLIASKLRIDLFSLVILANAYVKNKKILIHGYKWHKSDNMHIKKHHNDKVDTQRFRKAYYQLDKAGLITNYTNHIFLKTKTVRLLKNYDDILREFSDWYGDYYTKFQNRCGINYN